jgi:hypothetical protein
MKSIGYGVLIAGLVGGLIFLLNLMSEMAGEQCNRNCPQDRTQLVTYFDLGWVKYRSCNCK